MLPGQKIISLKLLLSIVIACFLINYKIQGNDKSYKENNDDNAKN